MIRMLLLATLASFHAGLATAAFPPDSCVPPIPFPSGPNPQTVTQTTFTVSQVPNLYTVVFWRDLCPGSSTNTILYVNVSGPVNFGAYPYLYQSGIKYDVQFSTSGPFQYPLTRAVGFDSRNPYWLNNGEVTLEIVGTVVARGTLPAYLGSGGGQLVPQVGLWWNPNESGSGYNIDVKRNVLVVTVFSYKPNGEPEWYLASGPLSPDGKVFVGTLDKYRNGQCISCPYSGPPTLVGNDGVVEITFSTPTSAIMRLPGGRVTSIQPQGF